MLAARIEALAAALFPNGRREGAEWRVGSLAGEPGKSLGIHLTGTKAGVWSDFSAGEAGDALDLVVAALYHGDKRQALAWARRWLGMGDNAVASPSRPAPPARKPEMEIKRTPCAWHIFAAAQPKIAGTPVEYYLAARGIDLRELGRQPRALRFHPALHNREVDKPLPAMIAAVSGPDGKFAAVHRTWLECSGGVWRKARLESPKMAFGRLAGGCIRLWRGAGGKPLSQAPAGEALVVAEGIETGLSVAIACPERRVIAAVSLSNMGSLVLPPAVTTITIAADNDAPDSAAAKVLQRAVDHFAAGGRRVLIARSPRHGDFNDLLAADAPG
jgi:hypothetical protein